MGPVGQIVTGRQDALPEGQAQWWRAYVLAENDRIDELRQAAEAGDPHALHHLAGWLAGQGALDELRELLTDHRELLASSWAPT